MTVVVKNGFAEVEIDRNTKLVCSFINGKWDLKLQGYGIGIAMVQAYICEEKSRLSTINKYAAKYGVQFVQL